MFAQGPVTCGRRPGNGLADRTIYAHRSGLGAEVDRLGPVLGGVSSCAGPGRLRMIAVMVRKVSVVVTDDLDGSPSAEVVSFGQDGVSCEIDLGPANKSRLSDALAPGIAVGRRIGRRTREPRRAARRARSPSVKERSAVGCAE